MVSLDQFKSTYINECYELLADMEARLMLLNDAPEDLDNINAIFRCAHSIKGGAGAFGYEQITNFTHELEALLKKMRDSKIKADENIVDILLKSADVVLKLVKSAEAGEQPDTSFGKDIEEKIKAMLKSNGDIGKQSKKVDAIAVKDSSEKIFNISFFPHEGIFLNGNEPLMILRELKKLGLAEITLDKSKIPTVEKIVFDKCYLGWAIKLTTQKEQKDIKEVFEFVEDECELKIEEVLLEESIKEAAVKATSTSASHGKKTSAVQSIRVDIEKIDRLINMIGEVVIT